MEESRGFARAHDAPFLDFYCHALLELVLKRSRARHKGVPGASVAEWWHLADLDMRERPAALADVILRMLEERAPSAP